MTRWLLSFALLSGMAHGFETIDNNLYFPAVAQGHRGNTNASCNGLGYPALTQNNQAKITGTGGAALNFCASNQGSGMPLDACDHANGSRRLCTITGNPIRGLATSGDNSFLSSSGSDGGIDSCSSGQQLTLGSASQYQFGTISLYSACTLTFSSTRQEYRIQALSLGGAKLVLPAGDYWIDRLVVNQGGEIETRGNVRIFVNAVEFNSGRLNVANTGSVLLFGYQNINLNSASLINGLVYADQALNMNNASVINGRTTSRSLFMSGSSAINDKVSPPVNALIDHFEFDHGGNALTCNPETLTIRACANASCSQLFTDPVTATLLPVTTATGGWIGGNQVSFSNGSTSLSLRQNTAGTVTVGVSGSTPSTNPPSTTLCRAGSGVLSAAACTLNFADSGFLFDVQDTLANKPQQVVMKAVKRDDASQQCVPGFANVSKPVSFWSDYVTPNANLFGSKVMVNGSAVASSQGSATASNLSFDGKGEATLTVSYPDAGKMHLNVRHDGSGDTAGLVMTGADTFISRPVGLCITPAEGSCTTGNASCAVFKKTGEAFPLNIKGVAWQVDNDSDLCSGNLATPNFALANIALGSELVAPKPGVEAAVGTLRYDHSNGKGSNNLNVISQSVNEVGVFRMTATPPVATSASTGYFGYTIPPASSVPVGRFIPVDFNLVSGEIMPACDDFSYMGQPFQTELHILARNQAGGVTQNYRGDFAKGNAYLTTANNSDGVSLSARLRSLGPLPWEAGKADFIGPTEFVRLSDTQPDGPYRALLFGLYMQDNDGEQTLIASPDFNAQQAGPCSGSGCNARLIDDVPMEAYFGRIQAGTVQGVASAPLTVPLELQYHEAGIWHRQGDDQCTRLSLLDEGVVFTDSSQHFDAGSGDLDLGSNVKIRLGLGETAPGAMTAMAQEGEIGFQFAAPESAVRIPFRIDLSRQPESALQPGRRPLWLLDPQSLNGMAIFGMGRGNDRIIYRREVMH